MTRLLAYTVVRLGDIITAAICIKALMSWFMAMSYNSVGPGIARIYELLTRITDPFVVPCRNFMQRFFNTGMFDFSSMVAIILIELVTRVIGTILISL